MSLPTPDNCIALIPARGGSKRIPRKNILPFCGKPIIAWSIEAALSSGLFGSVIVSTDDDEIAEVARHWGATVPFKRPDSHSDDHMGIRDVIVQGIEALRLLNCTPTYVCCTFATAPFVRASDLRLGLEQLVQQDAHFAYSVTRFSSPIQRAVRIRPDGRLEMIQPEYRLTRSQDLEEAYHDAAQFYWGRADSFLDRSKWIPAPVSVPVVLPMERVQDIDTLEEWHRAEKMFQILNAKESRQT